ncbi:MAG TPA: DUF5615 family PIN-like protein [Chloroflexota bacterium]|nr:DUF5615 family PIN-like protein [Chloroflexota bacterium]
MLRLLADENFDNDLIRGVLRRQATCDIVRVQDVGLTGADDPSVLAWAAEQGRIVLSHDLATLPDHAYARIGSALPMPGVFAVAAASPIGQVIEDVLILAECSDNAEWDGRVLYLPL